MAKYTLQKRLTSYDSWNIYEQKFKLGVNIVPVCKSYITLSLTKIGFGDVKFFALFYITVKTCFKMQEKIQKKIRFF